MRDRLGGSGAPRSSAPAGIGRGRFVDRYDRLGSEFRRREDSVCRRPPRALGGARSRRASPDDGCVDIHRGDYWSRPRGLDRAQLARSAHRSACRGAHHFHRSQTRAAGDDGPHGYGPASGGDGRHPGDSRQARGGGCAVSRVAHPAGGGVALHVRAPSRAG